MADKDFFMSMAVLAAQRSKDPKYQVGACIVNTDGVIVGIGYNGFHYTWCKDDRNLPWDPEEKHFYVCHAELNAITFRNSTDVKGCTIYQTLAPCDDCAKYIVQSKIARVWYLLDDKKNNPPFILGKDILMKARVHCNQFEYNNIDELPSFIKDFKPINTGISGKRETFLRTNEFFQHAALLASKWSQGPANKTGVSIEEKGTGIFLGFAYNVLLPAGCGWSHAIVNALINNNVRMKKCKMYSTHFPCNKCVQSILQHNINLVEYNKDDNEIFEPNIEKSKLMISKSEVQNLMVKSDWKCEYHQDCELN